MEAPNIVLIVLDDADHRDFSFHNHDFAGALLAQLYLDGRLELEGRPGDSVAAPAGALELGGDAPGSAPFVGEIEAVEIFAGT